MNSRKRLIYLLLACALVLLAVLGGCSRRGVLPEPAPAPTPSPTPLPTPEPTPAPVEIGGKSFAHDTAELDLTALSGSAAELESALSGFTALETVDVSGWTLSTDEQLALAGAYPDVTFYWDVEVLGVKVNTREEALVLDDIPLETVEEVERVMPILKGLQRVDMCHCGIDDETMYEFRERWETPKVVWVAKLGVCPNRTDITGFNHNTQGVLSRCRDELLDYQLKYFPDLVALDLGHCKDQLTRCDWLKYTPNLEVLILTGCDIRDLTPVGELKNLSFFEAFSCFYLEDITPLANLTELQDLNLSWTPVKDISALAACTKLDRLWLNLCDEGLAEQVEELREQLPNTTIVYNEGAYSTANGWREHDRYFWMRDMLGSYYMK